MRLEITLEQVKERYPALGEIGIKLTRDYINLTVQAVELKLIEEKELHEIESRYEETNYSIERLHYLSADILSLLKTLMSEVQVPEDSIEFEEWKKHSIEYPRVLCHDGFFDLFISSNEALSKDWE